MHSDRTPMIPLIIAAMTVAACVGIILLALTIIHLASAPDAPPAAACASAPDYSATPNALALLLQHCDGFEADLTLSGATITTDQGDIQLPPATHATATKRNGQLSIHLTNPPRASKHFLGIPVSTTINDFTIGESAVTAEVGGLKRIRLMVIEEPADPPAAGEVSQ